MRQSTKKILPFVFVATALLGSGVQAAQLGKLEVLSTSTEPFLAQIQVDAIKPEQRKGLQAKLASPEAFKAARLQMDPRLSGLKFEITEGPSAETAVIRISSDKPVVAGFVDALVELSWAGGRVAREYTFNVVEGKPAKAPAVPEIKPPQTLPPVAASTPPTPPVAAPDAKPAAPVPVGIGTDGSRVVKKGQTLSELASSLTGKGVSLNQAMAAIYEANRDAFINNSVHLVREGAEIRIPNKAALRARTANEALLVLAQNDGRDVYSRYARQIGLTTVANQQQAATSTQAAGKVETKPVETAPAAQPADRLKIAPSNTGSAKADANAEELAAKNKALAEANERVALLEKNVSDLQKLLEMQKEMVGSQPEPAAPPAAAAEAPTSSEPPLEPAAPVDVPSEALSKAEEVKPAAEEKPVEPEKAKETTDETTSLVPWLLGGAGGLLALVIAVLVWRARAAKRKESPFVEQAPDFESVIPEDNAVPKDSAQASTAPVAAASLTAVANDDFDLDDLISKSDDKPSNDVEDNKMQAEVPAPVEPDMVDAIPELPSESAEAASHQESLRSDVKLDFPEESLETKPEQPSNSILDDLDLLEKGAQSAQEELNALRSSQPAPEPVDLDMPDDEPEAAAEETPQPASESPSDAFDKALADIDLDVAEPAAALAKPDDATWQEVATKLDLAGAYVEIGDADGAKELLNEIVKKGDAEQVSKAKALLATLR